MTPSIEQFAWYIITIFTHIEAAQTASTIQKRPPRIRR